MTNDAAVFLAGAGEEARAVDEGDDRHVERVAQADEAGDLVGGVDVQRAGHVAGLVGDDADRITVEAGEADYRVGRVVGLDLEEAVLVEDHLDCIADVVRLVLVIRDEIVEGLVHARHRIFRGDLRRFLVVVLRQIAQEQLGHRQAFELGFGRQVRHAAARGVHVGATEFLGGDFLARHRLDDVRTGEEHVARAGHDDEVGQGRGVNRTAGAGAEDDGNLGDDTRGGDVAHEHFAVGGEAAHTFLDAGAARIVQADDRDAGLERHVLNAADLLRLHFGERTAQNGEVLCEDGHATAVDLAEAGDDAVAGVAMLVEAEGVEIVRRQGAELLKRAFVEEQGQPLTRGQFSSFVLLVYPFLAAAEHGTAAHFTQHLQMLLGLSAHHYSFRFAGFVEMP